MPSDEPLRILPQPDNTTCGPTCLHAVYQFFGDDISLECVIRETTSLEQGGTLAVLLGSHALHRGYRATIYTYNLTVFDPTWFAKGRNLIDCLLAQMAAKDSAKLRLASQAYVEFLQAGGQIQMQELNSALIRRYLKRAIPILTGLSATYLYQCERETELDCQSDDIRGVPTGHFVVLCDYDQQRRTVGVADPFLPNPLGEAHHYEVELDRLICSILLGVLTYDANLLVIEPQSEQLRHATSAQRETQGGTDARSDRD